jgi:hypothetical protein
LSGINKHFGDHPYRSASTTTNDSGATRSWPWWGCDKSTLPMNCVSAVEEIVAEELD